ncbi:MAG: Rrf2 family transcriptional regulator [Proteobacteria bacterium]|nr:Rrf2 family transcriptional regulator [Pseudomonadota bacterium]
MWLNQRTIDAIRLMLELARLWPDRTRAVDLPESTGITIMNIQKTIHALALAGLLETQRGRSGGVRLARQPAAIDIGEIVRAFEPTDCPVGFFAQSPSDAAISRLLFKAHRGFFQPLEGATLADLLTAGTAPGPLSREALPVR